MLEGDHLICWREDIKIDKYQAMLNNVCMYVSWSLEHLAHPGGRQKLKNAVPGGREVGEMFKMTKTG